MKQIELNGKKHPFKATLTALRKFEEKFDTSFALVAAGLRVDQLLSYIYFGIEAGYKIEGKKFDIDYEELSDSLDIDDLRHLSQTIFSDLGKEEQSGPNPEKVPVG